MTRRFYRNFTVFCFLDRIKNITKIGGYLVNHIYKIKQLFFFLMCLANSIFFYAKAPEALHSRQLIYRQLEQSVAALADQLLEFSDNIDELIPLLIEIAGMYGASHIILPRNKPPKGKGPIRFLKRIGIGFLVQGVATIAHETGHAIAAKLCKCTNVSAHLGSNKHQQTPIMRIQAGSIPYTIHSPYIINGHVTYTMPAQGLSRLQKAFIALAGGSTAVATLYIIKVINFLLQNKDQDYHSSKERIQDALYKSLSLDSGTTSQLIDMLIPLTNTNDGAQFWNAILNK